MLPNRVNILDGGQYASVANTNYEITLATRLMVIGVTNADLGVTLKWNR